MLPYGTLWKLDEMLHPTAAPAPRTVALRRRQALFYFVFGCILVTIFLVPYHFAELRRQRIEGDRQVRGFAAPQVDMEALQHRQDKAFGRLKYGLSARDDGTRVGATRDATLVAADFASVFYYQPTTETHLRQFFDHPYLRALAGAGSGKLWTRLKGGGISFKHGLHLELARRLTLDELAAISLTDVLRPNTCILSLHRDYCATYAGHTGTDGGVVAHLASAMQKHAGLRRADTRADDSAVPQELRSQRLTDVALAELLLWLLDGAADPEEALVRVLASCTAPISRLVQASFNWESSPDAAPSKIALQTTVAEFGGTQPQYLCLCNAQGFSSTRMRVSTSGGQETTLFWIDPRSEKADAPPASCAEACERHL